MIRVVGLGAGGHAKVMVETLRAMGDFEIVWLLDSNRDLWNRHVIGVPVLGDDDQLPRIYQEGVRHAFVGVGSVGDTSPRRRLYAMAREQGFDIVTAIHPAAIVSPSAELGHGATIMAGAVINAAARLGANVIVNTGAIVEHDCIVGDHAHIATGARLASTVNVGAGAHVGAGATVRQCITIGEGSLVGAGAVVVRDVLEGTVVAGVPAEPLAGHRSGAQGATLGRGRP